MGLDDLDLSGTIFGDAPTSGHIATSLPDTNNASAEITAGAPVAITSRVVMARGNDEVPGPSEKVTIEVWGRKDIPAPPVWLSTPPTRYLAVPGGVQPARTGRGGDALQAQVVAGLAEGHTHAEIAEATGKSERTVRRWAAKDDIKQRVKDKVDETMEMRANAQREAMAFLSAHQLNAAIAMVQLAVHAESESVRLRAQEKILELGGRQVELDLLGARVDELEWARQADQDDEDEAAES